MFRSGLSKQGIDGVTMGFGWVFTDRVSHSTDHPNKSESARGNFATVMSASGARLGGLVLLVLSLCVFSGCNGESEVSPDWPAEYQSVAYWIAVSFSWFWLYTFALAPVMLIFQQKLFLRHYEKFTDQVKKVDLKDRTELKKIQMEVEESAKSILSRDAISSDYRIAMVLNVIGGILFAGILYGLGSHYRTPLPEAWQDGISFGALGSYVYVLMMLGSRTFQHDISPGVATWCGVQLLLGPIVGGVCDAVLSESVQLNEFTQNAIFFVAGLTPRELVTVLQNTVRKLWQTAPSPSAALNLRPLNMIHGLTPAIEERLEEEGITDVQALAMANPLRLVRDLPYEFRQILTWMDEALLLHFLDDPVKVQQLQKLGISGAIDLAYYHIMFENQTQRNLRLAALAIKLEFDPDKKVATLLLEDLVRRLDEDGQVKTVWLLYQAGADGRA